MNNIEIRKVHKVGNWYDFEWFIDGIRLSKYLIDRKNIELPHKVEPFDDLCPAWTKELDYAGDVKFVWHLIGLENAVLPIYMCPDDLDFSCIVLVVEVEKTKDYVYWNRVGYVNQKDYDFELEKRSGILHTESYSDRDWEKYGDNIALEEIDSDEWLEWISENWEEELFRRRMNYTFPNYQKEGNILWFADLNFVFLRNDYEAVVDEYWERETLYQLENYRETKMDSDNCVNLIMHLTRNGQDRLEKHLKDYGEVLLHIYASDELGNPLYELLEKKSSCISVNIYCKTIELMWKYGDDTVRNVVDVTLLERLSDSKQGWEHFGKYISEDFKKYINEELLSNNIAMCGVSSIK